MRPGEAEWMLREVDGDRWLRVVTGFGDRPFTTDESRALRFASEAAAVAMAQRLACSLWRIQVEPVSRSSAQLTG